MATQQGWDDFCVLMNTLKAVDEAAIQVEMKYQLQTKVKDVCKRDILQDAARKAAAQAIADTHPKYTMAYIESRIEKLLDLNEHLEDVGFYPSD